MLQTQQSVLGNQHPFKVDKVALISGENAEWINSSGDGYGYGYGYGYGDGDGDGYGYGYGDI